MYVSVCCLKFILVLQSAVVLLLFSCCHRNTVVAKLPLLLPCYHISCSRFPRWLRSWPRSSSHILFPLQAACSPAAVGLSKLILIYIHINRKLLHSACRLNSGNLSQRYSTLSLYTKKVYSRCKPQSEKHFRWRMFQPQAGRLFFFFIKVWPMHFKKLSKRLCDVPSEMLCLVVLRSEYISP